MTFVIGKALPPFDPDAEFVVAGWPKGITLAGIELRAGEKFPKQLCRDPVRQTRTFYEHRWIKMAPPATPVSTPQVAASDKLPIPGGKKPRLRSSRRDRLSKALTSGDSKPVPTPEPSAS